MNESINNYKKYVELVVSLEKSIKLKIKIMLIGEICKHTNKKIYK